MVDEPPLVRKWATTFWLKFANDRTGLSSGRKVWSAANSGRAPRRKRAAWGRSTGERLITGVSLRKSASRCGPTLPRSRTVGPSASATGLRLLTSGWVLIENADRRSSVARDSSRKTGKMSKVAASAFFSAAVAEKVRCELTIRSCSCP